MTMNIKILSQFVTHLHLFNRVFPGSKCNDVNIAVMYIYFCNLIIRKYSVHDIFLQQTALNIVALY